MPLGVYERTEEHKLAHSEDNKGTKQSAEWVEKRISKLRGRKQSPEVIKNKSEAMMGRKLSEKTRQKMSESRKGKKKSEKHKQRIANAHIGIKPSEDTRKKLSIAKKGIIPWNKGVTNCFSEDTLKRMAISRTNAYLEGKYSTPENSTINGRYKGLRFASTVELNFLLNYENIVSLIRADAKGHPQYKVRYVGSNGKNRVYNPDYFDPSINTLYEIKQVRFRDKPFLFDGHKEKEDAAIKFCEQKGWKYKVVEVSTLDKRSVIFPMRQKTKLYLFPNGKNSIKSGLLRIHNMFTKSYSYFDGKENRWASNSEDIYIRLVEKVREVFKLDKYKDGGLTEKETIVLLNDFLKFMSKRE